MPERLLVVGPAWVGDMVMSQSLLMTLAAAHPAAALDVLAPAWSLPLLRRMPEVSEAIEMPLGHGEFGFSVRRRLGRSLRDRDYLQAIVLPRSLKSALVPFFAGVPLRTGYRGEMRFGLLNDIRPLDTTRLTRTVQRYVALGRPADADQPPPVPEPRLQTDAVNQQRLLLAAPARNMARPSAGRWITTVTWLERWRPMAFRCGFSARTAMPEPVSSSTRTPAARR